ncbi:MAG: CotH kinase family protein [Caldilineaceae bacterium]
MPQFIFNPGKNKALFQIGVLLIFVAFLTSVRLTYTAQSFSFQGRYFGAQAIPEREQGGQSNFNANPDQRFGNLALKSSAVQAVASSVVINEFMSSNVTTIADEDGSFEDWIELYNSGSTAVSLLGVGLSDTIAEPFRWTFPDVTIAPGKFLLVWASGKNRTNLNGPLHTNFSISAGGEPLILTDPVAGVLDQVAPIRLPRAISYGRSPNGSATLLYFDKPTPGSSNNKPGYSEVLSPPLFSQNGGFYTQEFDLSLSSQDGGVTIYFTLDGSAPDPANLNGHTYSYKQNYQQFPNSPVGQLFTDSFQTFVYSQTLHIQDRSSEPDQFTGRASTWQETPNGYIPTSPVFKGTIVRARVIKPGALPSPIVTHTYFVTPEGAQRYTLPVLSLGIQEDYLYDYDTGIYVPGAVFDQWRQENPDANANASVLGNYSSSTEYPISFELFTAGGGRVLAQNLGFRIHGGQSRAVPQKSLRLYANAKYDTTDVLEYPFFPDLTDKIAGQPITTFHRILLRNSGDDYNKTRMRDAFIQTLLKPMGLDGLAYQPAVEFINGEYWGLINIRERLDRYYLASHYRIDPNDAALLENDAALQEGDATDVADFLSLRTYIQEHDMADPVNYAYAEARMDMENFILYNVAEIYTNNTDWPHNNIQYWRKRTPDTSPTAPPEHDGRWRWILYDLDFGFNLFPSTEFNTLLWATKDSADRGWSTVMLRKLLANPNFRNRFINAASDHLNTTFQPDHVVALANLLHDRIAPYLGEHSERWRNTLDTSITPIIDFGTDRPGYVRDFWESYFGLSAAISMTFNVSDPKQGNLQINTVTINQETPGLPNPATPYPWQGLYYSTVPIEVTAHALPGYRFVGWLEYPDELRATITITPAAGATLTALFEQQTLLHYWDFNDTANLLIPKYSFAAATLSAQLSADAAVLDGSGQGFADANAQLGSATGSHLRVNNPLGASLVFTLPTTGMRDIVVRYESRRSGQGAGTQKIDYTVDGNIYVPFTTLQVYDGDPVLYTLNFAPLEEVNNNPHFGIRITFEQGAGGVAGNNRFDNFSMTGNEYKYFLFVNRTGTGAGTVTTLSNAINCGTQCAVTFDIGTTQSLNLSATPQAGSIFAGWSGVCSGTNICSLSITQTAIVTAIFNLKTYTVALSANPSAGGAVSGGGSFNHGTSVTVVATANNGYIFADWSENGATVSTDASYSFPATANRNLVANFSLKQYTINVSANPIAGGVVSGGGTVNHGVNVSLVATANEGYTFTGWSENGVTVSANSSYSFPATANRNLVANFSFKQYTISVSANPLAGGVISGGGTVNHGANVSLVATANEGYTFTRWSENGSTVSTNASYSFPAIANRNLVANFSLNHYTIAVSADPAEGGTVSGGGGFNHGETVTVVASANNKFAFVGWNENGATVSTKATYSFVAKKNRTLVAKFVTTPLAVNDVAGTSATSDVEISVLDNDSDPAGGGLRFVAVTQPAHGTVITSTASNSIHYTPQSNFSGADSFTYTVEDIHGSQASAKVIVIVTNPADGMAAPQLRVVDNNHETILSFSGMTLTVPAGSYSETLGATDVFYIVFTEIITPAANASVSPGDNLLYAGRAFMLEAYVNDRLLANQTFPAALTLSVFYDPADVSGLDEKTIAVYFWNEGTHTWSEAGLTRLSVETTAHVVTYRVEHFTEFALFAEKVSEPSNDRRLWLPLIAK